MTDAELLTPSAPRIVEQRRPAGRAPDTAERRRSGLSTVALTLPPALLALTLSVVCIGARSMWNDEYASWYASTLSFRT
jgi:hypothetical protein